MHDLLDPFELDKKRALYIGFLSAETVQANDAEHLGSDGYFLFEASDEPDGSGVLILGKLPSIEAAFRLIDIWKN